MDMKDGPGRKERIPLSKIISSHSHSYGRHHEQRDIVPRLPSTWDDWAIDDELECILTSCLGEGQDPETCVVIRGRKDLNRNICWLR